MESEGAGSPSAEIKAEAPTDLDEDGHKNTRPKRRTDTTVEEDGEEVEPKESAKKKRPKATGERKRGNFTRGPYNKPTLTHLKRTGESFLQDGPCFEVAPKLVKCRECRLPENQSKGNPTSNNIFCRFYAFRRLRYSKFGLLLIAGFSNPFEEPIEIDRNLWLPTEYTPPPDLTFSQARFLLAQVGDQFCDLLAQENDAKAAHMSDDTTIAWKRVVKGVREMCDVCETSLFNYHWTCRKCGFVVCLDCYKCRKAGVHRAWGDERIRREVDSSSWLMCAQRTPHDQSRLMLTQIIAGDSLQALGRLVHSVRSMWGIAQHCGCALSKECPEVDAASQQVVRELIDTERRREDIEELTRIAVSHKIDPNLSKDKQVANKPIDVYSSGDEDHAMLRDIIQQRSQKKKIKRPAKPIPQPMTDEAIILDAVLERNKAARLEQEQRLFSQHRRYLPIRIMTYAESTVLYPDVPHTWLCDGKLLRLNDPLNAQNVRPFQEQWKRGQPVLVSHVSSALNMAIWCPESFSRDFGEETNDLVNCMTGNLVPNQRMKWFWDGFDFVDRRLKDGNCEPMLLKLKDWPPGEDFAEILPTRYIDLMKNLPLGDYTKRNGKFNLASRLPDVFVKPDLGPKMYNAYGSALHADKGTTNLHLDISDAVNVMVYVGISRNSGKDEEHVRAAYRAVDEAGCDIIMRRRVRSPDELPGAIWHIYAPRDADKIRDLLNKVAIERGRRLEPNHDPIHDQSWYLDGPLRERLYNEYSVEGYPIAQCRGDAVFIPAGAPHQVRNLHNCIKVAEDFVSPENVSHCFHLTQEFRNLSDTHSNHEDKLQIKNIIYHAVKDAVAGLSDMVRRGLEDRRAAATAMDEPPGNGGQVTGAMVQF